MTHFFEQSFGNLKDELALAKQEGKLGVFVMFNDPDCPWCQKMKATMLNQPAVQDYYRYTAIQLAPPSAAFRRGIEAVDRSWREHGGDPDVGLKLPAMMVRCGFEVREVRPVVRVARPGSQLWQWPTTFFRNHLPMLVEKGFLSDEERRAFDADWAARSADPGAFFASPPMVEIVAVKRAS
jgi:hypothetical protein